MNIFELYPINSRLVEWKRFVKNEWIRWSVGDKLYSEVNLTGFNEETIKFVNLVNKSAGSRGIQYLFLMNEVIRNGPKVVKPTFEQCLILEQIEININVEEYLQPYETVVIELPDKYVQELKKDDLDIEKYFVIYKNTNELMGAMIGKDSMSYTSTLTKGMNIEESLSKSENLQRRFERVCFNLNMLMVIEGVNRIGYENIKRQRALVRQKRDDALGEFYYIGLKQNIQLFRKHVVRNEGDAGEGGRVIGPHWRKGHLRRQRYGVGRVERKLIFIRPTFVCSDKYRGDMSDTGATYQG